MDCSVALAWILPDESSPRADRFLAQTRPRELWVPVLFWYELANALTVANRRKRISEADLVQALDLMGQLPIATDAEMDAPGAGRLRSLAAAHKLSGYDAAYLDLALRKHAGMATLDTDLQDAARAAGIDSIA